MKLRTLAVAAGIGAPLIANCAAHAGYLGVSVVSKPNAFGLTVCNVYAEFDNPGGDWMQAVASGAGFPGYIEALGGTFYNHPFGSDRPPAEWNLMIFPSLAYDSFYTIGRKFVPTGQDDALNLVNMPALAGNWVACDRSARSCSWAIVPPTAPQGNPFDAVHSFPGDGRILIGQFSMESPSEIGAWGVQGEMMFQFVSDGVVGMSWEAFSCVIQVECLDDDDCNDGDPCNGEEFCVDFACAPLPPDPDCNGNGVLDACDIADGTSTDANGNGIPDDCDVMCQADLNFDGRVSATDFLELLAQWGDCP
jgi:hypothetical protein